MATMIQPWLTALQQAQIFSSSFTFYQILHSIITKKITENAEGLHVDMQNAITMIFSPSPTFSDINFVAWSDSVTVTSSHNGAKSDKLAVERKLLCIDKQMKYHKYVTISDFFTMKIWKNPRQSYLKPCKSSMRRRSEMDIHFSVKHHLFQVFGMHLL